MNLTFYTVYTIPYLPNPDPDFFRKLKSGSKSEKCSRTPDPLYSGSVPISGILSLTEMTCRYVIIRNSKLSVDMKHDKLSHAIYIQSTDRLSQNCFLNGSCALQQLYFKIKRFYKFNIHLQVLLANFTGEQVYKDHVHAYQQFLRTVPKTPKGLTWLDQWGSNRYAGK